MFSKTGDPATEPQPRSSGSNVSRSVLGPDLKITGEITSTGALEVLGEIDGTIQADSLTVGPQGRVSGTIVAKKVEVTGRVDGRVESDSFTMRASAEVTADVSYSALIIESGASIEGRFTRLKV